MGQPAQQELLDGCKVYQLPGADAKETKTCQSWWDPARSTGLARRRTPRQQQAWISANLRGMLSRYSIANIPDGTSNTILVIEASNAVPWTKPEDVMYDPQKPMPKFGKLLADQFLVGLADGSVRFVTPKVKEKTLRQAIEPSDGNVLGEDWN